MPLPLPDLDTRTWTDLTDEARALIPRYAPAWSDHNLHDPGITIMELLAWLVEMDVYQLDRVTDASRLKFLALAGITPQPPRAATAMIGLAPPAPVVVPRGAEFQAVLADGTLCLFRTLAPLTAVPSRLVAVKTRPDPAAPALDLTRTLREGLAIAALGDDPTPGAALWLGFDAPLPVGQTVTLGLVFGGGSSGPDERQRILDEAAAQREACRRPLPPALPCAAPAPASSASEGDASALEHPSVRLAWEFYTAAGSTWRTLDPAAGELADDTRALTLDGLVSITLPEAMGQPQAGSGDPAYYLRVRLLSGDYDTPPQLTGVIPNAARVEQAVPLLGAYPIAAGIAVQGAPSAVPGLARLSLQTDAGGTVTALGFDRAPTDPEAWVAFYQAPTAAGPGTLVVDLRLIGRGDGTPNQRVALPQAAVQGGSFRLTTLEDSGARDWQPQPDFFAATGGDATVVLDASAALTTYGDGDRGRVVPRGATLLCGYRATRLDAGNVASGALTTLAPTMRNWLLFDAPSFQAQVAALGLAGVLADPAAAWGAGYDNTVKQFGNPKQQPITNPFAASGGAAAETLAQAAGRAALALQTTTRAVTAADFETLALQTPGTAIARAHALPGQHPAFPCLSAPGVVTLIVVPAQHRAQPTPSAGLLRAVRRYLNRRRLLGTHVEVVAPTYVTIQVTAQVQSAAGANPSRVQAAILDALNAFFDPIRGGRAAIRSAAPSGAQPPAAITSSTVGTVPLAPGVTLLAPATAATTTPPLPPEPPPTPGWPFGRDVYRTEVMQVIAGVPGVDTVLSLDLSGDGGPPQCGNVCVGPTSLVVSGQHTIGVM